MVAMRKIVGKAEVWWRKMMNARSNGQTQQKARDAVCASQQNLKKIAGCRIIAL
jgi:hypothetical protein